MTVRPFSLLKSVFDPVFPLDTLVMYEQDGMPYVGIITGTNRDKYLVTKGDGTEHELARQRLHKIPMLIPETCKSLSEKIALLRSTQQFIAEHPVDLERTWTSLASEIEKILPESHITETIFQTTSLNEYVATRFALLSDRIYFKRDKDGFIPRPREHVEQLKSTEVERAQKISLHRETAKFLKAKSKDKSLEIPNTLLSTIALLEECAATSRTRDNTEHSEAEDIILTCEREMHLEPQGRIEQRAFHILYKAGHFKKDVNLFLIRHKPRLHFSLEVMKESEEMTIPSALSEFADADVRKDFTHLSSFTIDDESTSDMDDALAIEETDFGYRLYVHISDVAYAIAPGSALDLEAQLRATSIYCPDITINMLPDILCHDKLSLVVGKVRPCISCIFDISHSHDVLRADIAPSIIKVDRKFSYTEVDDLLDKSDQRLTLLHSIAATLEQKRISQGATRVTKRDAQPILLGGGEVKVVEVDEQSAARNLIGEMMVLANSVMANFLCVHEVPALFRGQDRPDQGGEEALTSIPTGPARDYADRVRLKRSIVSTIPSYHATLGLNAYLQCSSPIRRYVDLVLQRQILKYLQCEKTIYTSDQLLSIQDKVEEPLHKALFVSKETKRYWMLRYLEKYYLDQKKIRGTVVRVDTKMPMVELDEIYIIAGARIYQPQLGMEVMLSVTTVDPRSDYVRLEEVKKPQNVQRQRRY